MTLAEFFAQRRGSQSELSKAIAVPASLLSAWATEDRAVPDVRCPEIELATKGLVTCEELLPSQRWVRVKDKAWPHPAGRPLIDMATSAIEKAERVRAEPTDEAKASA